MFLISLSNLPGCTSGLVSISFKYMFKLIRCSIIVCLLIVSVNIKLAWPHQNSLLWAWVTRTCGNHVLRCSHSAHVHTIFALHPSTHKHAQYLCTLSSQSWWNSTLKTGQTLASNDNMVNSTYWTKLMGVARGVWGFRQTPLLIEIINYCISGSFCRLLTFTLEIFGEGNFQKQAMFAKNSYSRI